MNESDGDVVRAVLRGERDAFSRLVQRYQARLFGLVLMMVRDRAAAEDVTQDAFVRAYAHLEMYDERRPFYPWLATIAVRLAQNQLALRARTMRREGTSLDDAPDQGVDARGLATLLEDERSRALWSEVSALPSGERTAVLLHYRQDLPVGDVARALGVTAGTIKTLLFRARRRLRERLQAIAARQEISR